MRWIGLSIVGSHTVDVATAFLPIFFTSRDEGCDGYADADQQELLDQGGASILG